MNFHERFETQLSGSVQKLLCNYAKCDTDDIVEAIKEKNRLALISHIEDFIANNRAPKTAAYVHFETSYLYFTGIHNCRDDITRKPYIRIGIFYKDNDENSINGHCYILEHSLLIDDPRFEAFDIFDYEPTEPTYDKKQIRCVSSDIFKYPEKYDADTKRFAIMFIQDFFRELVQMNLTIKI